MKIVDFRRGVAINGERRSFAPHQLEDSHTQGLVEAQIAGKDPKHLLEHQNPRQREEDGTNVYIVVL